MSWVWPPAAVRPSSVRPRPHGKRRQSEIRGGLPPHPGPDGLRQCGQGLPARRHRPHRAERRGGHRDRLHRGVEGRGPQHQHRADAHLSVRLAVELRARHQNCVARSPATVDAAGFYIKWKNIQQEILLVLRLSIHRKCRRRSEQGRRIGGPRKAGGPPRAVARLGLPGCENHSGQPRVSADGRLAHLSGARLDRQRVGAIHDCRSAPSGRW